MGDVLSPRARRALAVIAPLPVSVTDWQFADPAHGWVLLTSQTDPNWTEVQVPRLG